MLLSDIVKKYGGGGVSYANLLPVGACESLTGWSAYQSINTIDTVNKYDGNGCIKSLCNGDGSISYQVLPLLSTTKYYMLSGYLKNLDATEIKLQLYCTGDVGARFSDGQSATVYDRKAVLLQPSDFNSASTVSAGTRVFGTGKYAFLDNLMLNEISAADYASGVAACLAKYPYKAFSSPQIIVYDSFNRTDSATLGNADTGQVWVTTSGIWGINSGRAYMVSAGASFDHIAVDAGIANARVSVDVEYVSGKEGGLILRMLSGSSFVQLTLSATALTLKKLFSGYTTLGIPYAITPVNGTKYNLSVEMIGDNYTVKLDGTTVITATNSHNNTSTAHGLRAPNASVYFDNFKVEAI